MTTRLSIDELARRERLLRAARIRQIASAFERSPAIITEDHSGRRELVIMSDEIPTAGRERQIRVTYFASDGPRGHFSSSSWNRLVEHVADGFPANARPATENEVIAWTSTPEFAEGSARIAEVQRANEAHAASRRS